MEQEIELFNQLKETSEFEAQIIGKNIFFKNIDAFFGIYESFCIENAKKSTDNEIAQFFLAEAESALQLFSEKCTISKNSLSQIREYSELYNITSSEFFEKLNSIIAESNDSILSDIDGAVCALENDLNSMDLKELASYDSKLNKESFSDEQSQRYSKLSKRTEVIVSKKIAADNKNENEEALNDFKYFFDQFNQDRKIKNDEIILQSFVRRRFLRHNISHLQPGVVTYYNYVYGYIFNKLSDEMKFKFTKMTLE